MFRFGDSFDHYSTAQIPQKWTTYSTAIAITSPGANGPGCMTLGGQAGFHQTLTAEPTWVIGFRFNLTAGSNNTLCCLFDGGVGGTMQCELRVNSGGTISVMRNNAALAGGTSTVALPAGVWTYVEWMVTIGTSIAANSCIVRINNSVVINVTTGQSTQQSANAHADTVVFGRDSNAFVQNVTGSWDDVYILDGTGGAPNNTFWGDTIATALLPAANGSNTAWSYAGGSSAWASVADNPPDGDTSYIFDSNPGDISTFPLSALGSSPPGIHAVQVTHSSRMDVAGAHSVAPEVRSGGTNYPGTAVTLTTSYAMYVSQWPTDPATGLPWTSAGIAAVEVGINEVS